MARVRRILANDKTIIQHAIKPIKQASKRACLFLLVLSLLVPFLTPLHVVHADTTFDQIVSDLGLSPTDQNSLLQSLGRTNNQFGCELDIHAMIVKKPSMSLFATCNTEIGTILNIVGPYIKQQQNIGLPVLSQPFGVGPVSALSILQGVYTNSFVQSLLTEANKALDVNQCRAYVASLTMAALVPETYPLLIGLSSTLATGFILTCGAAVPSLVSLIKPVADVLLINPTFNNPTVNASIAPTARLYCPALNYTPAYFSIACMAPASGGGSSGNLKSTATNTTPISSGGGQSVPACTPGQNQVAVYTEKNYQGSCVIKGFGDYNNATAIGLPNDSIKSVKAGSGAKVWLCANDNINNPCEWFPPDDNDLSNNSINVNTVSSMRVISDQPTSSGCNPGDNEVSFFVDPNWSGACITKGFGVYSDPGAIGVPNDSISSIRIGARAKVRVCNNAGMNSPCEEFDQSDSDLANNSINTDTISAAEVYLKGGIRLCDGTNYGGQCKYFGTGKYNLQDYGFNNVTESVAYDSDWAGLYHIVLYTENNQTGYLYHADNNVGDLGNPYNNNISSIEIYKHTPPGATLGAPADNTKFTASTTSATLNFDGGDQRRVKVWGNGIDVDPGWGTAKTLQLSNLTPGTYYWQVQAKNVAGEGAWSETRSFAINCPPVVVGGDTVVDAGTQQTLQLQAYDADADTISLSASNLPSWASFTDAGSGIGNFTVSPNSSNAGQYQITITASDGDTTANYTVNITVNATTQPNSFVAEYFNNMSLSGTPMLTRAETNIDYDWGGGSPDPSVPADHFSARWAKTSDFAAGDYAFTVTADDGVRLYLDGTLVVDKWIDQGATTYTVTKTLAAGNHTVKMEYYENSGGAIAKFSYQQVTPPPAGSQTVTSQIAASSDDGEENASTSMSLTSSDLELTCDTPTTPCPSSDPGKQAIGMRFGSLGIPKGATINSAFIVFTAKEAQSEATSVTLSGQAADNASTFTTTSGNISSRTKTVATVSWSNLPAWTVGTTYQTPDLSAIMQQIVSRSGWASGNAAAVIVTGLGHRTAWSYDGNSSSAAKLVVNYTPVNTPTPPPAVIASGLYKLVNVGSSKALDVNGGGTSDGTNVQIWSDNGGSAQKWQVSQNTDGTYKLVNPNSSKVLDVNGAGTSDGTNVQIWSDNSSAAQKWQIIQNTDGTYKLINPNSNKVLDVSGGNTTDGTNVQIWTDNSSAAQKWQITAVSTTPLPPSYGVTSLTLINTDTDQPIASFDPLADGVTLNLATLPTRNLSIRANTSGTVGSVKFNYDSNAGYHTENTAPYGISGDNAGDYTTWTPSVGQHTLTVTAYSGADGSGAVGGAVTRTFSVVDTPSSTATELLSSAWNLAGNNGASEKYQSIASNALAGKTTVRVTYNLHGLSALGGDASALIFDQNGWHYVSLSNYGQNGLNGLQTVDIPLNAFGLDLSQPVGTLHARFWYGSVFTVDITSVQIL